MGAGLEAGARPQDQVAIARGKGPGQTHPPAGLQPVEPEELEDLLPRREARATTVPAKAAPTRRAAPMISLPLVVLPAMVQHTPGAGG